MDFFLTLDQTLFSFFNGLAGKYVWLDFFWFFLAEYIVFLIAIGTILFIIQKTKEEEYMAVTAFLGVIIARIVIAPLFHALFFRPRPFVNNEVIQLIFKDPESASFPSGHTVIMFALAFAVFHRHRGWGSLMLIFALSSGIARVVSGVHFPTDILAGIIIGFLAYHIAHYIIRFVRKKL